MGDPQDIFSRAMLPEQALDKTDAPRQRPATPAPPASPFSNALTPEQDFQNMDAATKAGQAKVYQRQLETYNGLKKLAEIKFRGNPEGLEDELQKIQLSMYLGQQLNVDPEQVHRGWNSLGDNPYASQYYESRQLPKTYWGYMKDDIDRAVKTYRALNMATGLLATPYREGKYDKLLEVLQSMPEDTRPPARRLGSGGLADWLGSIPSAIISQVSFLADMGLAGLVGGLAGGAVGSLLGPEAIPAGVAAGRQTATFLAGTRLGAASIFMDTMTMIDPESGLPLYKAVKDPRQLEDIARWSAAIWGGVEGAIGMVQFESLLGKGVLKKAATDTVAKGAVRNIVAESLKKYGKNILFQTGTEPVQEMMELIGQDIVAGAMNQKQGMALPRATAQDFARLAATTADVTFRSSLLFTLPGSVIEAKASIAEKIAAWDQANAEKRIQNINKMVDASRPYAERVVDIDARLEELRKANADLEQRISSMPDGTFDEKSVRAHSMNADEIKFLEWSKEEEASVNAETNPYRNKRDEWQAKEAARKAAEGQGLPEATERQEAASAVLREPQEQGLPYTRNPEAGDRSLEQFMGLQPEQITPEIERQMDDYLLTSKGTERIPTAAELGSAQNIIFTGGLAGGGKGSVLKMAQVSKQFWADVNSDNYREMTGIIDPKWQKTAGAMADRFYERAWSEGYNVLVDSQMTSFSTTEAQLQRALAGGGDATFVLTNIDAETSRARVESRRIQAEEKGEVGRKVPAEATAKGWNRFLPTFIEFWKRYKDNPRVHFYLQDNNTDFVDAKTIIDNSTVVDQTALDEILATRYVEIEEEGAKKYERTEDTRITAADLEGREPSAAAVSRAGRIVDYYRQQEALARGRAGSNQPGKGAAQLGVFTDSDLTPGSPIVLKIRYGLPNLTVEQAQGAALYAKLIAAHKGMSLEDYINNTFVRGIFSKERAKEIEAMGKRGGIDWNAAGKAIFYTTRHSDFGTWVHELTHLFEYDLDAQEKAAVYGWLGATDSLTGDQRERWAYAIIDYIRKGYVPHEDLRPAFDRFSRWLLQIYGANLDWQISPEIKQMLDEALAGMPRLPKDHVPDASPAEIVFETDPNAEPTDASSLTPDNLLLQSNLNGRIRAHYLDAETGLKKPGVSSLTTPMADLRLTVGQWMIDDELRGVHGREIAQLRLLDPNSLLLSEDLVETNTQGRGDDAARYADWMRDGKTPPPISVVETDKGSMKVIDGHRRTAAAKMAGQQVLAWVWPAMDHPAGLTDSSTGMVQRVGLTYEQATGRTWPGDKPLAKQWDPEKTMAYETRPGDKDPWILKSREVIHQKMRGPQPASAVKSMLEANGVKAEEMEWLGLNDFLKGTKKVTPEEVLNYIEANHIEIKEVLYRDPTQEEIEAETEARREKLVQEQTDTLMDRAISNATYPETEISEGVDDDGQPEFILTVDGAEEERFASQEEADNAAEAIREQFEEQLREDIDNQARENVARLESNRFHTTLEREVSEDLRANGPKFSEYKLPGGKNYRELLLTIHEPKRTGPIPEGYNAPFGYKGPHWSEMDVLLHVRFDERTDAEGSRVLFIEEIQSDWHQQGREKGYQGDREFKIVQESEVNEATGQTENGFRVTDNRGGDFGYFSTREKAEEHLRKLDSGITRVGVPNAPFKKTWPELAMRRMLRWATEEGFDQIAWTTGEQQAERYSLAKQVDAIRVTKESDGTFTWSAMKGGRMVHEETAANAGKLEEYIGKDLAKKADAQPADGSRHEYTGVDLRVGGEGMRGFYDEMLVQVARKLGKKYGAKVDIATLAGSGQAIEKQIAKLNEIAADSNRTDDYRQLAIDVLESMNATGKDFQETIAGFAAQGAEPPKALHTLQKEVEADTVDQTDIEEAKNQALGKVVNDPAHYDEKDEPDKVASLANMVQGFMDEEEQTFAEAIEGAKDAGVADEATINQLVNEVDERVAKTSGGYKVHSLTIPDAMKTDVRMGQMLFEPSLHEENVRQAVEQTLPVPDDVLEEYIDREWAQKESDRRLQLVEAARSFSTFEDFLDWQARSTPEGFPNRHYYENIWRRSQATNPSPEVQSRSFREALEDDETIHYIVGGFAMVHEQDLEAQGIITKEMKELGRRLIQNEPPDDLTEKVRVQLRGDPTRWNRFFDKYLPDDVKADLKTAMAASQEDFVPVLPKVANERFTRNLQREGKLEDFLLTVGPTRLQGKSKLLTNLAERLRNEADFTIDAAARHRAMREIRKSITTYREAFASATNDEEMLRQLYAEADVAVETEEARLKTENQRLRSEMKKAADLVRQTTLKQLWTMKDLEREQKERAALKARYDQDIADAKEKLKLSVQEARKAVQNKALVEDVIKTTLWKKRMAEIKKRNEADLAVLKARVKQVRDLGRQRLQSEKDKARIRFYAEAINRPVNAGIADEYARRIEDIQARIAYDPEDVPETVKNKLREWRRRNPNAPMPSDLVQKIEASNPRLITAGEMAKLYEEVKALRTAGRKVRMQALLTERNFIQGEIGAVSKSIQGTREPRDLRGYGTKGTLKATKTPAASAAMWATWRMNRIAEMLDGGRPGPTTNWLWDQVNDRTDDSIRTIDAYATENQARLAELRLRARDLGKQESIDGLKITHGQMIGVYVYSQFEDGLFSLKEDNRIPEATIAKILKALTPEEKEYGDWMIDRLSTDADFDRLQQVQIDVSNTRMDRLPRYFPMQRQGLSGNPLLSDLAKELLDMAGKTNKPRPRAGFLKSRMERTEGVSFPPLRLDAPAIYMDHISKREFYIANAQLIKRLNRIFDSKEVKAAMADRYGDKMQPLVQKYIAQYSNPNIYRAFEDYGEFARILRGNIGMSLIGSNLVTMLKQLPDIPQIMVMAGPVDGIRAAAQFIANPRQTLQQMWEKAPQLKARSYDRFIEELKTFDRNGYERVVRTVGEAGFAVLKAMDTATNVIGWTAIYNKTMRRTGNENLAVKAARDFIFKKRPAARAKDLAAIYRSTGLSWFLMFSNQQNQQWNILTYDIPNSIKEGLRGNGGAMVDAALNVTGLLIGAVGMGLIARKGAMSGSDLLEDFLNMLFGNTPFIGNAVEAAIRGQPAQDALNPFAGAYQLGKIGYDVANQADTEKVMRDLQNALFTLAGTAGFPVVQARRIYKTIESGDPWDLIGGPPKKEK